MEEQEQLKQRSELGKAAEAAQKLAHLERISSRLQEVDDPRTYAHAERERERSAHRAPPPSVLSLVLRLAWEGHWLL